MSKPDWLTLEPGESVVWSARPCRRRTVATIVFAVVWSAGILGFAYAFVNYIPPVLNRAEIAPAQYVWLVAWALVALWAAFIPVKFLGLTTTEYALTDRNLYVRSGGFSTSVTRIAVENIQNTTIHRGLLGDLLEYAAVEVSAGGPGTDVTLRSLEAPERFRQSLQSLERSVDGSGDDAVDVESSRDETSDGSRPSDGVEPR